MSEVKSPPFSKGGLIIRIIIRIIIIIKVAEAKSPPLARRTNYAKSVNITIDQQYADDIGWASTDISEIETVEKTVPPVLKDRNLFVNESKTEKYQVKRDGSEDWKECKYVGSLLDTERDIKRRKQLANNTCNNLKNVFASKNVTTETKFRLLQALVESIFLYNCELWTLTQSLEDQIDIIQRQFIRRILNIRWYERTRTAAITKVIARALLV